MPGGHVRIYRRSTLRTPCAGRAASRRHHHAHALHSPYWWLSAWWARATTTTRRAAYHRLLVWDIVGAPLVTRFTERVLNPCSARASSSTWRSPHDKAAGLPDARPSVPAAYPDGAGPTRRPGSCRCDRGPSLDAVTIPEIPGVLTRAEVLATAPSIAAVQRPDGMIPWFAGGHCDPWNHVEAAMALTVGGSGRRGRGAYRWLADTQLPDGSWFNYYPAPA